MLAATAIRLVGRRLTEGTVGTARLSPARTAGLLLDADRSDSVADFAPASADDLAPEIERTAQGPARRVNPPLAVAGAPLRWVRPARRVGTDAAAWG